MEEFHSYSAFTLHEDFTSAAELPALDLASFSGLVAARVWRILVFCPGVDPTSSASVSNSPNSGSESADSL